MSPPPKTTKQVFAIMNAYVKRCGITWTHMAAQGLTMAGPPWRVTVTVAGKGKAVWTLSSSTPTPTNALAKKLSAGCR